MYKPQVTAAPKVQGNLGTNGLPKSPVLEEGEHPKPKPQPNSKAILHLNPDHNPAHAR